jgi:hypothetical protein
MTVEIMPGFTLPTSRPAGAGWANYFSVGSSARAYRALRVDGIRAVNRAHEASLHEERCNPLEVSNLLEQPPDRPGQIDPVGFVQDRPKFEPDPW